uniref:Putative membrane protein n=1 Tax=Ixodes ricinus TaxID=34613 RepID=A0A090XAB8_IXORI
MRFTLYIIILFVRRAAYQKPSDTEPVHFSCAQIISNLHRFKRGKYPTTSKLFLWINFGNILPVPRGLDKWCVTTIGFSRCGIYFCYIWFGVMSYLLFLAERKTQHCYSGMHLGTVLNSRKKKSTFFRMFIYFLSPENFHSHVSDSMLWQLYLVLVMP